MKSAFRLPLNNMISPVTGPGSSQIPAIAMVLGRGKEKAARKNPDLTGPVVPLKKQLPAREVAMVGAVCGRVTIDGLLGDGWSAKTPPSRLRCGGHDLTVGARSTHDVDGSRRTNVVAVGNVHEAHKHVPLTAALVVRKLAQGKTTSNGRQATVRRTPVRSASLDPLARAVPSQAVGMGNRHAGT